MPTINRVRVVNFKYDNDKKYIGDMLLELQGENSLINLENGGGKSVILQLALQVLLPNAELSNRKFVDYFKVNSGTAHIMIEWLLDSTVKEYLLTGICATRDSEGLKFFTYTHAYGSQNECDIKRIPVVNSKKQVTGYSEFYKFLRGVTSEYRINTYSKDRMRDYRDKLASHSLFENEFEAIRVINQSEGGIEKFFERARKSRNVIERLIIPAIPTLAGEEQSLLAGTFKKHMENLKSIPVLQYNLEIYEGFLQKGTGLLKLLEEYQQLVQDCSGFKGEILVLENILHVVTKRLADEAKGYQSQLEEQELLGQELDYKRDSLEIYLENREMQELEQKMKNRNSALRVERQRLEATQGSIKYMNSSNAFLNRKEQKSKYAQYEEKLILLNLEEKEIQQENQDCLFYLSTLLDKELVRVKALMEEGIQKSKAVNVELEGNRKQSLQVAEQKQAASNELAVSKADKARLEEQYRQHSGHFNSRDMTLLLDPVVSLKSFDESLEHMEKSRCELEDQLQQFIIQDEDAKIKTNNLNLEKNKQEERLSAKKQIEQAYVKKLAVLVEQLKAFGVESDIYSNAVSEKLLALIEKTAGNLAAAQVNHNTVENKKLLLDGLDYYLPDKDVLKVYRYLTENGVASMPGSLWLKNQPADAREELLKHNPIIPFSIIVEAAQLERVAALSESMAKLAEDYPVAIITANTAGLDYIQVHEDTDEKSQYQSFGCLDPLKGSQIFILRSENSRLLINDQELKAYIESLGKRLEKNRDEMLALKTDQEKIISMKERVADFLTEYSLNWKNVLVKEIDELKERIHFIDKEAERVKEEHRKIKERISDTGKLKEETEAAITNTQTDIREMQILIDAQKAIVNCDRSISRLAPLLKELIGQETELQNKLNGLLIQQREQENKGKELEREIKRLSGRLSEVQTELTISQPSKDVQGSIDELEAKLQAQKGKLSESNRESIHDMLRITEASIGNYSKVIKSNGYTDQDFENIYEMIQESEITKAEEAEKEIKAVVLALEKECQNFEIKIGNLNGIIDTLDKALDKNYGKAPWAFEEGETLDFEFYEEQRKALKVKKNRLVVKYREIVDRQNAVEKQLELIRQFVEDRRIEMSEEIKGDMLQLKGFEEGIGLWDMMKMEPVKMAVLFKRYKQAYDEMEKKLEAGRSNVGECFDAIYSNAAWRENTTLKSVLSAIMKENLYNVRYMQELFTRLFESVGRMRDAEALQLEECRRNKGELVERCLQRAKTVYDEVKLVDSFSKIKVHGENQKVVKIEMPKLEEEQGRSLMALYLEKCIEEIGAQKEQGSYDAAKIDNTINSYMAPQALLDAVISLNDITIKVFKPEHNLELSQYVDWEVVIQWSGGEKLAGFFAMFISIVSYLRYKRTGYQGSAKVIWIDNPFGQANAGHLLGYIFELAKATNTQMICLTGLQETTIYAQFNVVYSLVHRMLSNMSIIQPKQVKAGQSIEVGYYNLKEEQMSFI